MREIPWPEVVKMHQTAQNGMLETIELYSKMRDELSQDPLTPEDTLAQLLERIRFWKHQYLGLEYPCPTPK